MESDLLTITEAAKIKGCTRKTIYDLIEKGKINVATITGTKARSAVINDDVFKELEFGGQGKWGRVEELEKAVDLLDTRQARLETLIGELAGRIDSQIETIEDLAGQIGSMKALSPTSSKTTEPKPPKPEQSAGLQGADKTDVEAIRDRINRALDRGVTQAEISKASGVDSGSITRIISGERKNPRRETLKKIMHGISMIEARN